MALNLASVLNNYDNTDINEYFLNQDKTLHVRQFPENEKLFLLSNEYLKTTKSDNSDFYRECKSVIIYKHDEGLTSIANGGTSIIDINMNKIEFMDDDLIEELVEGTNVTVFNFEGTWNICTTKCTDSYKSYFNPVKSFGTMFDECLENDGTNRELFLELLDKSQFYNFIIVHHENKYITDYTEKFGFDYKLLVNNNRDKNNIFMDIPHTTCSANILVSDLQNKTRTELSESYSGLVLNRQCPINNIKSTFRIMSDSFLLKVSRKPNHYAKWACVLQTFLNSDPKYSVQQYIMDNCIDEHKLIINKREVNIIGMFCLLYKNTALILNKMVLYFTTFDHVKSSFTKINEIDFAIINTSEHSVLKAILTTMQYGIKHKHFKTDNNIIMHLKRNVRIKDFICILRSLKKLENKSFCLNTNTYYSQYQTLFLNLIDEN